MFVTYLANGGLACNGAMNFNEYSYSSSAVHWHPKSKIKFFFGGLTMQLASEWWSCTVAWSIATYRVSLFGNYRVFFKDPNTFLAYFRWYKTLSIFKRRTFKSCNFAVLFCFPWCWTFVKDQFFKMNRSFAIQAWKVSVTFCSKPDLDFASVTT